MIRISAGPARIGKTTGAEEAVRLHPCQYISQDYLRDALVSVASDADREILLVAPSTATHTKAEWLRIIRKRDEVAWRGTMAYILKAASNDDDVLIEGCIWPDHVDELSKKGIDFRAGYTVDTALEHADRVIAAARSEETHNNWQEKKTDEYLRRWAGFNIFRSLAYVDMAQEYDQPVFDVANGGYEQAQAGLLRHLFPELH